MAALGRLTALIRRHHPDVLHLHTSQAHGLGAAAVRLAGRRRPAVLVTRRVEHSIFRHSFLHLDRLKYAPGADRVLCVSQRVREVLRSDGLPEARLIVVPDGVDLDAYRAPCADSAGVRASLGIPGDAWLIGSVGHLDRSKGRRHLVDALLDLRIEHGAAHLLLVGEGPARRDLDRQVGELGLGRRVTFAGFRDDVPDLLGALDVFAFPSTSEGLGSSVLEALAAGVPVVATTAGGIPEAVRDGEDGLLVVPGGASQRFAHAIRRSGRSRGIGAPRRVGARTGRVRFGVEQMGDGHAGGPTPRPSLAERLSHRVLEVAGEKGLLQGKLMIVGSSGADVLRGQGGPYGLAGVSADEHERQLRLSRALVDGDPGARSSRPSMVRSRIDQVELDPPAPHDLQRGLAAPGLDGLVAAPLMVIAMTVADALVVVDDEDRAVVAWRGHVVGLRPVAGIIPLVSSGTCPAPQCSRRRADPRPILAPCRLAHASGSLSSPCLALVVVLAPRPAAQAAEKLDKKKIQALATRWMQARPKTHFERWDRRRPGALLDEARGARCRCPRAVARPVVELLWKAVQEARPRKLTRKTEIETPYGPAWWIQSGGGGKKSGLILGLHGGGVGAGSASARPRASGSCRRRMGMYPQGIRLIHDTWNSVHGERFLLTLIEIAKAQYEHRPGPRLRRWASAWAAPARCSWPAATPTCSPARSPRTASSAPTRSRSPTADEVGNMEHGLVPNLRNVAVYFYTGSWTTNCEPGTFLKAWDRLAGAAARRTPAATPTSASSATPARARLPAGRARQGLQVLGEQRRNAYPEKIVWEYNEHPWPACPDDEGKSPRGVRSSGCTGCTASGPRTACIVTSRTRQGKRTFDLESDARVSRRLHDLPERPR